jgi:hypothetical protein
MPTDEGVDYAWSHPGGKALQQAGKHFAARYLSNDPQKNISRAEADDLAAHDVSSVVVWESTAKRPLSGRAAGISDAKAAVKQAAAAGMPKGRPVYFAVDFDATKGQMAAVLAYLGGAASVLSTALTGVYGGIDVVRAALDGGHVRWAWQTRAWSEGHWDPRAHIRQGATQTIGGVSCDLNTAMTTDYGQWMPGRVPQEEDMPITAQDRKAIAAEVVAELTAPGARDALAGAVVYWLTRAYDPTIALPTGKDAPGAAAQTAALRTALAKHAGGTGITDAQLDQLAARMVGALVAQAATTKEN